MGGPLALHPFRDGVVACCHAQAERLDLPPNRFVRAAEADGLRLVRGPFFLARRRGAKLAPLTDGDLRIYRAVFRTPMVWVRWPEE